MRLQPIYDIAELCAQQGIMDAIVCPGSRCAPLTIAFSRHPHINVRTFSDERSAAFIALGIAQQTHRTVVLICTSGSAAYNFAPAVAEAYYNHVPLLILTADRPKEWIGQLDGQTIQQDRIYGRHVKSYFELPADYEHNDAKWMVTRSVNEALLLTQSGLRGPVHVNVPLREPLYEAKDQTIHFTTTPVVKELPPAIHLNGADRNFIETEWPSLQKVLIVGGQQDLDNDLLKPLNFFTTIHSAVLAGDVISNLHGLDQTIRYTDSFLAQGDEAVKKSLQPDLLITFGRSVISKNLKLFLRKYKPAQHWHIQPAGDVADTFQSLTRIIRCDVTRFFDALNSQHVPDEFEKQKRDNYKSLWKVQEHKTSRAIDQFFAQVQTDEFHIVHEVIRSLPAGSNLHLANSMTVRYANFIGLRADKDNVTVYSNRGTSGIDGCTSTAAGHSLSSDRLNVLITGDVAFFYDRNAFWHNYELPNLRIVVLNNHGGAIFGMIDGPGSLPEAEEFFITRQKLSAKNLCQEFHIDYARIDTSRKIKNVLADFFEMDGRAKLIEIDTDSKTSQLIFEQFKQLIKQGYES